MSSVITDVGLIKFGGRSEGLTSHRTWARTAQRIYSHTLFTPFGSHPEHTGTGRSGSPSRPRSTVSGTLIPAAPVSTRWQPLMIQCLSHRLLHPPGQHPVAAPNDTVPQITPPPPPRSRQPLIQRLRYRLFHCCPHGGGVIGDAAGILIPHLDEPARAHQVQ